MGQIKQSSDQAFRDFVVDGLASSGANKPDKAAIRTLFSLIDSLVLRARRVVNDTDVAIAAADRYVALTAITAARIFTLPKASDVEAGLSVFIVDESGQLSATKTVSVVKTGSDTIDGNPALLLAAPYAAIRVTSNGANAWKLETAYDTAIAKTNVAQIFTKPQKAATSPISSGAAWDASQIQHATVNVNGGLFTVANPTGLIDGCFYAVHVTFTTSHALAWGSNFKGVAGITPSGFVGKKDFFMFRANGTILENVGYKLDVGA